MTRQSPSRPRKKWGAANSLSSAACGRTVPNGCPATEKAAPGVGTTRTPELPAAKAPRRRVPARLANARRGLVLMTGPTGAGNTTTLPAMIDHINTTREVHVVTIEDPIEVLHNDKLASIEQREIGVDTDSFGSAMRAAMRQDPDVILVGEMRDEETVAAALSAAETGHLVLSTLHTIDATETVNRIVDFFPPHKQKQIRLSLAGSLKGIVCQRLVPRADTGGRVAVLRSW